MDSLSRFVSEHKHLPHIPSKWEIKDHGLQVGDITYRLVRQLEELTLHCIRMHNELQELKESK